MHEEPDAMMDSRARIKDLFKSGAIPSERDFAALIDLMVPTDVFDSTIAALRDDKGLSKPPGDGQDRAIALLRREKEELEARIDREIATLRAERGAIEPLLHRRRLDHRREIEAASDYLEREIVALNEERDGLRLRQDREISDLRTAPAPPAVRPPAPQPKAPSIAPIVKRQVRADGTWQTLQVDHPIGAFAITATMNASTNISSTLATIVIAGLSLRPTITQKKCYDRGLWILLVPAGTIAITIGSLIVWLHGLEVWKEPWSAAGLWLTLVGIAAIVIGIPLHRRRGLTISWQRKAGPLALKGPGVFRLRSNGRFLDGDTVPAITYTITALDG